LDDAPDEVFIPFAIAHSAAVLFVPHRLDRIHPHGTISEIADPTTQSDFL
jgi:hypothetical protein